MAIYNTTPHPVVVHRIAQVGPLMAGGKMLSPDAGLMLVIEGGKNTKWLAEKDGAIPSVGDFLVRDPVFGVTFTVSPRQLKDLFTVKEDDHE